jgi:hypothetical protein
MGKNFVTQNIGVFDPNVEQKFENINYLTHCIEQNPS